MPDEKKRSDGGMWLNNGQYGEYFSGNIEVNGGVVKFNAYPNKYKKEGDRQPDYRIQIKTGQPAKRQEPDSDVPF